MPNKIKPIQVYIAIPKKFGRHTLSEAVIAIQSLANTLNETIDKVNEITRHINQEHGKDKD